MIFTQNLGCGIILPNFSCLMLFTIAKNMWRESVWLLSLTKILTRLQRQPPVMTVMEDFMDYKFCTVLGFLPGAGVFYDWCERHAECGVDTSIVQWDMSWFRLSVLQGPVKQLGFGTDGYVRRFGSVGLLPDSSVFVSGWRMSRSCSVKKTS